MLLSLIDTHGPSNWVRISQLLGTRTPKQCRERYHQNLKPSLNHSPITEEEGRYIEELVARYGKKWAEIARHLDGRSDNAVKNWWNGGANRRRRASRTTVEFPSNGAAGAAGPAPGGINGILGANPAGVGVTAGPPPSVVGGSPLPATGPHELGLVDTANNPLFGYGSQRSLMMQQGPQFDHLRHRVSLPNIHAYHDHPHNPPGPHPFSQHQPPGPQQGMPFGSGGGGGSLANNEIVFNKSFTSDSSGFRKSSAVQLSGNVDPHHHDAEPGIPPPDHSNTLPALNNNNNNSGALSHSSSFANFSNTVNNADSGRFARRNSTRSSQMFVHSPLRKNELYSNTPYTRRFSTASDNEDPLSLSKYSLNSGSNSRRNSHAVPMPPAPSTSPPPHAQQQGPPQLLTMPATSTLQSLEPKFGSFSNPFGAKRHSSVSGPSFFHNQQQQQQQQQAPPLPFRPTGSVDPFSRPSSEVLESWGARSDSTMSSVRRRSSSASSHDPVAPHGIAPLPVAGGPMQGPHVSKTVNSVDPKQPPPTVLGQKISISNLLS